MPRRKGPTPFAMNSGLAILVIGFFLGMRHATDPDHVIAVSTIVSRERSIAKAALIGVLWGIGHTVTILGVGAGIILFGLAIPARVGLTMEFSVGLMLVLLGILNLTGALKRIGEKFSRAHVQSADEQRHNHKRYAGDGQDHVHGDEREETREAHLETYGLGENPHPGTPAAAGRLRAHFRNLGIFQALRPLAIGLVHGLAGSAAVALLVLSTIKDPKWGVCYLLIFGVGTIAGMMLITAAIALPFSFAGYKFSWLNKGLITASGVLSLAFGLFVCYQIGIVDGLFSAHPNWTPS